MIVDSPAITISRIITDYLIDFIIINIIKNIPVEASKSEIIKTINNLKRLNKEVLSELQNRLKKVEEELKNNRNTKKKKGEGTISAKKPGKANEKKQKTDTTRQGIKRSGETAEKKPETLTNSFTNDTEERSIKRKKNIIKEGLEFKTENNPKQAPSTVVATRALGSLGVVPLSKPRAPTLLYPN